MRDFVVTANTILEIIPHNRITYKLIQEITKIRDEARFVPPEIIIFSWQKLHACVVETFEPENFQLVDWEQEVINILVGSGEE